MGNKDSRTSITKLEPRTVKDLENATLFTKYEIQEWYKLFTKENPGGKLDKEQFKRLYSKVFPQGNAAAFAEHTFRTYDRDSDGTLNFKEFMVSTSVKTRGTLEERIKWAFEMYDVDNNGYIERDEMLEIVKAIYAIKPEYVKNLNNTPDDFVHSIYSGVERWWN